MKPTGSRMLIGFMLLCSLALLAAAVLWWGAGIWPSSPKAWIFILIISPILWVVMEAISDTLIDAVDYLLPRPRYSRRPLPHQMTEEELAGHRQLSAVTSVTRFLIYLVRAAIAAGVIYLLYIWLSHKLELPDSYTVVQQIRYWWFKNFQ